jgi:molybdenum cofactor biosynthesis protein MoaC/molybdopterin converting factor subunit 1
VKITVLLFATLRRRAGTESVDLDLAEGATAADALAALAARDGLRDLIERLPLRVAVNREYVPESTALAAGDEVAVIPPVSGGARPSAIVTGEPLSVDRVLSQVSRPAAGATVVFVGSTREVSSLEYEAYREMAEERMADILEGCIGELRLEAAAAEHRVGTVPLSEPSVIVAVSAPHRAEAFAGARRAIDRIKEEAPIWKIEAGDEASVSELRHLRSVPASPGEVPVISHLDSTGAARMVDVSGKAVSDRRARAEGEVRMSPGTARAVARGDALKGDVLGTARIAAIQAAKKTSELVPLAHPLPLTHVDVDFGIDQDAGQIEVIASAQTTDRTGVEMEAMTAVAVAALTIYDMVKGLERGVEIGRIRLLEKSGGRQDWRREGEL